MSSTPQQPRATLARRSLLRTAAWAAPTVAVAAGSPAFASSGAGALSVSIEPGRAAFTVSTWNGEQFLDARITDAAVRLGTAPAEAVTLRVTLEFRPVAGVTTGLAVTEKVRPNGWNLGEVTERVTDAPSGYVAGRTITWNAASSRTTTGEQAFSGALVGPYSTQRFGELVFVATAVDAQGRVLGRSTPWAVATPTSYAGLTA